jgi:hypothetical protein
MFAVFIDLIMQSREVLRGLVVGHLQLQGCKRANRGATSTPEKMAWIRDHVTSDTFMYLK